MIYDRTAPSYASSHLVFDNKTGQYWVMPRFATHTREFLEKFGKYEVVPTINDMVHGVSDTNSVEMAQNPFLLMEADKYAQCFPDQFKSAQDVLVWAGLVSGWSSRDFSKRQSVMERFAKVTKSLPGRVKWKLNLGVVTRSIIGPLSPLDDLAPPEVFYKAEEVPGWDDKAVSWKPSQLPQGENLYEHDMMWRHEARSFMLVAAKLYFLKLTPLPFGDFARVVLLDGKPDMLEAVIAGTEHIVTKREKMIRDAPSVLERALNVFRASDLTNDYFIRMRLEGSVIHITTEINMPTTNEIEVVTDALADLLRLKSNYEPGAGDPTELLSALNEHKVSRKQLQTSPVSGCSDDHRMEERLKIALQLNSVEIARLDFFVFNMVGMDLVSLIHLQACHVFANSCRRCCTGPPAEFPGARYEGESTIFLFLDWLKVVVSHMRTFGSCAQIRFMERAAFFKVYSCPGEFLQALLLLEEKSSPSGKATRMMKKIHVKLDDGVFNTTIQATSPAEGTRTFIARMAAFDSRSDGRQLSEDITSWAKISGRHTLRNLSSEELETIDLSFVSHSTIDDVLAPEISAEEAALEEELMGSTLADEETRTIFQQMEGEVAEQQPQTGQIVASRPKVVPAPVEGLESIRKQASVVSHIIDQLQQAAEPCGRQEETIMQRVLRLQRRILSNLQRFSGNPVSESGRMSSELFML